MEMHHGESPLCAVTYGSEGLKRHSGMIPSLSVPHPTASLHRGYFFHPTPVEQRGEVITKLHNHSTLMALVLHGLIDGTCCSYRSSSWALVHHVTAHGPTVWDLAAWKQVSPKSWHHGFGETLHRKQLGSQLAELSNVICSECESVQFSTCLLWKMNFLMLYICHLCWHFE